MTDIIERLRSRSPYLDGSSAERTMEEAADEIEKLRAIEAAALALCDECKPDLAPSLGAVAKLATALNIAWHARRALEHKP